jgi:hypothetical protein
MSLRRERRRRHERRRHHQTRSTRGATPADAMRASDDGRLPQDFALYAARELEGILRTAPWTASEDRQDWRDADEPHPSASSTSRGIQEAGHVRRLAYTRRQAAEALGVSISTVDRRVVPSIDTVKLPWGQRLIPVDELERFLRNHSAPSRRRQAPRPAGRPPTLPPRVVERVRLEYARGRGLSDIARRLTDDGVATAHGGRKWWPSTVRAVLVRSSPAQQTEVVD